MGAFGIGGDSRVNIQNSNALDMAFNPVMANIVNVGSPGASLYPSFYNPATPRLDFAPTQSAPGDTVPITVSLPGSMASSQYSQSQPVSPLSPTTIEAPPQPPGLNFPFAPTDPLGARSYYPDVAPLGGVGAPVAAAPVILSPQTSATLLQYAPWIVGGLALFLLLGHHGGHR